MEEHAKQSIIESFKLIAIEDCYSSFRVVYDHYYNRLFLQAMYYFNDPNIAQELVSDIFVSLWQSRKILHKVTDPDAYLFICMKYARTKYIEKIYKENKTAFTEVFPEMVQDSSNPENTLLDSELEEKYRIAFSKLPPRCAEVFRLVREERKKYSEVAEILEISTKTVDNQMNKAVKILYSELKEHLFIAF